MFETQIALRFFRIPGSNDFNSTIDKRNKTYVLNKMTAISILIYCKCSLMNHLNWQGNFCTGLWDEEDGFFYDHIRVNGKTVMPLKILSMVGLVPLFCCLVLKQDVLRRHPGFYKRTRWFLNNRKDLDHHVKTDFFMFIAVHGLS